MSHVETLCELKEKCRKEPSGSDLCNSNEDDKSCDVSAVQLTDDKYIAAAVRPSTFYEVFSDSDQESDTRQVKSDWMWKSYWWYHLSDVMFSVAVLMAKGNYCKR
jgi:hypothetical protein